MREFVQSKARWAQVLTALVLLISFSVPIDKGLAAQRACTGNEIATAYSLKAQIQVERFYSNITNNANLNLLNQKLQNLYNTCETDGFKAGAPSSKAPVCSSADKNLLNNFRSAYAQEVNSEKSNSDEIEALRKSYNSYLSVGKSQLATEASLKISKLTKEIQHHYLMQIFYKGGFEALQSTCRNSGITLPPRSFDNPQPTNTPGPAPTLSELPERYLGYRPGDVIPKSITGIECGTSSLGQVSIKYIDSSGNWQSSTEPWAGKYDLGSKYAAQVATVPVSSVHVNLSSGEWQGIVWPYSNQKVFTLERCGAVSSQATSVTKWVRQSLSNLQAIKYEGSDNYYRIESLGTRDSDGGNWSCTIKKPTTVTTKKNGKTVKSIKPAVSDFKVNVTGDASGLTIWECDDLKTGQFVEVQKIDFSKSWNLSPRNSAGSNLWEIAIADPKHVNWTWACPSTKGNKTCYSVAGLK